MKKYVRLAALVTLAFIISGSLKAQKNYKFGHIDAQELLNQLPERDSAQATLEKTSKELEDALTTMRTEFDTKYADFLKNQETWSKVLLESKRMELSSLQERIENFSQTSQQQLQQDEATLMQPIIEKARKAIEDVASENNFTYIFDISPGVVLYYSQDSEDILPLVLKKLGIQ